MYTLAPYMVYPEEDGEHRPFHDCSTQLEHMAKEISSHHGWRSNIRIGPPPYACLLFISPLK